MFKRVSVLLTLVLCVVSLSTLAPVRADQSGQLSGKFSVAEPLYAPVPLVVGLSDASGLFGKDPIYTAPQAEQFLGAVQGSAKDGSYTVQLPAAPVGRSFDPATGAAGSSVGAANLLVFNVRLMTDIPVRGYMVPNEDVIASSLKLAIDFTVDGGTLIVWTADAKEQFPTASGADKKLFTVDDPRALLPTGWSTVNLDSEPFKVTPIAQPTQLDLATTGTGDVTDYTSLSCAQLIPTLLDRVQKYYPFTQMKHIDWQALRNKLIPASKTAQSQRACDTIIRDLGNAIPDGHVDFSLPSYQADQKGGLGMLLDQTSDGQVIVTALTSDGAGSKAGIKRGAVITAWDDQPIDKALDAVVLLSGNSGTKHLLRYIELHQITRGPLGSTAKVTFQNPGAQSQTAVLTRGPLASADTGKEAPNVTDNKLPSGIGYIRIQDFESMDGFRQLEQQVTQMIDEKVPGVIIDVRSNPGGLSQISDAMADRFVSKGFILGKVITQDGRFIYEDLLDPRQPVYQGLVAILVNANTASSGDIFAYTFKVSKRGIVVGNTPSAGMAGSPSGYYLPGGGFIQVPTSDFVDDSGKTIIEGEGVIPDVLVPVTVASLLSPTDDVLQTAEQALLKGQTPQ